MTTMRLGLAAALFLVACEPHVSVVGQGPGDPEQPPPPGPLPQTDKVDILVVVDNSRSMADKQEVLALAMADLLDALANPPCVDGEPPGQVPCPQGQPAYAPVNDIHIGVISSSLGGHGADACSATMSPSENDRAHLLSRAAPDSQLVVATYQGLGYLVWDPLGQAAPPGEADPVALAQSLSDIVEGVGEIGCGYEAPLESAYRFLVDPAPYDSIAIQDDMAVLYGTDDALLAQRAAFLRPDSAVVVVMISDENDCSTIDGGQYYFASQIYQPGTNTPYHLPKARAACAVDPNDPCCKSCGEGPGDGCDTSNDDCMGALSGTQDHINLRCYDQKRRFGIDFINPVDRYITGLTAGAVPDRLGNLVPNPLFSDLDPNDAPPAFVRDAGLVFFTVITGVPWQDVARDPQNLAAGLKSPAEMADTALGFATWDAIVGDPLGHVPPLDPLMQESIPPRNGSNPYTGEPLTTSQLGNSINGHEYTITGNDDLQYACIFPLLVPRDCATDPGAACDCIDPTNDSPLCEPMQPTLQVRAKAYPGIRQLAVAQGLGAQAVVSSICPANITDTTQDDYSYRQAMSALVERLTPRLEGH
jgi:hypothetical protein